MRIDHLNIFKEKNKIKGKGKDEVGEFTIEGTFHENWDLDFVK